MSQIFDSIFGSGNDDVKRAAEEQAAETRKAAEATAQQARFAAQAAQIQREGLAARQAAEEKIKALAPKPPGAPDVSIGPAPTSTPAEEERRRNPRLSFGRKGAATSIGL